jgi:hypothetical protein
METIIYRYDQNNDQFVKRIVGKQHGDGQVDSDENPIWLTCDKAEAEQACNGNVPVVKL